MKFRSIFAAALMLGVAAFAKAQEPADTATVAAATSLGDFVRQNISALDARGIKINRDAFMQVFEKAFDGDDTGMSTADANRYIAGLLASRMEQARNAQMADSVAEQKFVADAAAAKGAVILPTGTVMQVIKEGSGETPKQNDRVKVRYVGKLSDGTVFDDEQAEAIEFEVGRLIAGFTDGLMHMRPGGTYRIVIPASQGYGAKGADGVIPGNSALDFTVTLDEILTN